MAKKKSLKLNSTRVASTPAERELQHLKHKDLQRACVGRGMPFELAVSLGTPEMQGWFVKNYDNGQNLMFLDEFDDWKEEQLKGRGYEKGDPMFHPSLRLGFIGSKDDDGEGTSVKKPRLKSLDKKEKPKRERIEGTKVLSGTKKALTYQLTIEGIPIAKIIEKVMKQFPEASDKSIKIWHNKAKKLPKAK